MESLNPTRYLAFVNDGTRSPQDQIPWMECFSLEGYRLQDDTSISFLVPVNSCKPASGGYLVTEMRQAQSVTCKTQWAVSLGRTLLCLLITMKKRNLSPSTSVP